MSNVRFPVYLLTSIVPPAATLDGLLWLLPFLGPTGNPLVQLCPPLAVVSAVMNGSAGRSYNVDFQFRGIVEAKSYVGGSNDGAFWQIGGSPVVDNWNVYSLTISSPAQTYYLNRGTSGLFVCNIIGYIKTVQIDVGATVTLTASSSDVGEEIYHTLSDPLVTNPPQPYAGQFIHMEVLTTVIIP